MPGGERRLAHQAYRDGCVEPLGERAELVGRLGDDDAAADVEEGPLRLREKLAGARELALGRRGDLALRVR
jgi:hypothetical protein